MCGVIGSWSSSDYDHGAIAINMADQIVSRGPDNSGVWTSVNDGFALAHRRLAILLIYLQPVINLWFHLVSDMCLLTMERYITILTYANC